LANEMIKFKLADKYFEDLKWHIKQI
jgi:hypothetical protein